MWPPGRPSCLPRDPSPASGKRSNAIEFVVGHLGFERTSVRYLHPVEGSPFANGDEGARALHSWFFGPRDFAVIAYKPKPRAQDIA